MAEGGWRSREGSDEVRVQAFALVAWQARRQAADIAHPLEGYVVAVVACQRAQVPGVRYRPQQ